jgi:hypothetical protein
MRGHSDMFWWVLLQSINLVIGLVLIALIVFGVL